MKTMKIDADPMKWTVEKSEYLFKRPWLTVRRDEVRLPDGRVNPEFYVLEYPDWVNVIAITGEGKFVLVRQYRHGLGETRYELCAGVAENGEAPEMAARRELLEETGYSGGEWELLTVLSGNASTTNNLTHCFVARGVEKTASQHLDATEDLQVAELSEEEVFALLNADEFKQSLMAAPLWKYFFINMEDRKCKNS